MLQRVLHDEGFRVSLTLQGNEKQITPLALHTILIFTEPSVVSAMRVIRVVRAHHKAVPIIALGNDESNREIEYLLQAGANEYAKPPYATREFALRLRSRHQKLVNAPHLFMARSVTLDEIAMTVSVRGRAIALTALECAILARLMREPGAIVSAEMLLNDVWPGTAIPTVSALRTHVNDLRKKIESNASRPTCIISVRGQGYMFQENP